MPAADLAAGRETGRFPCFDMQLFPTERYTEIGWSERCESSESLAIINQTGAQDNEPRFASGASSLAHQHLKSPATS